MVRKALHMEQTLALAACLLLLCAAIKLSITQGTLKINRCKVCTSLKREGREEMKRRHMGWSRSQLKDSLVHGLDLVMTGATPHNLCLNSREDKVSDEPLSYCGGIGGV